MPNDKQIIDSTIKSAKVCHLAMSDGKEPYIVPLSFGYDGHALYFHGKSTGKKIKILKKNNRVSFEFTIDVKVKESDNPCKWNMYYKSVVGFGKAIFLKNLEEKKEGLKNIIKQYSPKKFKLPEKTIEKITVIKVEIENISSKTAPTR